MRMVLLVLVVSICAFTSVSAQSHRLVVRQVVVSTVGEQSALAIPENARLDRYPLMSGRLSTRQVAELGLQPKVLEKDWTGLNFDRKQSRFILETIPAGDVVLTNGITGEVVYRDTCGNRLVELKPAVVNSISDSSSATATSQQSPRTRTERVGDKLKEGALNVWGAVAKPARIVAWSAVGLVGLLIIPAILVLLGYLIYRRTRR